MMKESFWYFRDTKSLKQAYLLISQPSDICQYQF